MRSQQRGLAEPKYRTLDPIDSNSPCLFVAVMSRWGSQMASDWAEGRRVTGFCSGYN